MNSVSNNIRSSLKNDLQQYASNDSGLSFNSISIENDNKAFLFQDSQYDDLTKSLFMNSFNGSEIIQDDDIYSYKSKMEIGSQFPKKMCSFNFAKTESFNFKTSCSYQSIIHDVKNLKMIEPFYQCRQSTNNNIPVKKESVPVSNVMNNSLKFVDEMKYEMKSELTEKNKPKKTFKKNAVQEYVSSSIKDYRGDKALNDIVTFIQGSTKAPKNSPSLKSKINKRTSTKIENYHTTTLELALTTDSGVVSDTSSPVSKEIVHSNVDADSGTLSSHFVSLNNSDEDSSQLLADNFKQVMSKKQKKTSCLKVSPESPPQNPPKTEAASLSASIVKTTSHKGKKNFKTKAQMKMKCGYNMTLNSRENYRDFLSNQYDAFVKRFNTVS